MTLKLAKPLREAQCSNKIPVITTTWLTKIIVLELHIIATQMIYICNDQIKHEKCMFVCFVSHMCKMHGFKIDQCSKDSPVIHELFGTQCSRRVLANPTGCVQQSAPVSERLMFSCFRFHRRIFSNHLPLIIVLSSSFQLTFWIPTLLSICPSE